MSTPTPDAPFRTQVENQLLDVVAALEPDMDRATIVTAIEESCSNRPKRRRLAAAVVADPGLLTSGSPDGPVAVDHFLHRLVDLGARHAVIPLCPRCHKPKPITEWSGDIRICNPCKLHLRRFGSNCELCGRAGVTYRDRQGRGVCRACRPGQDVDPVEVLVGLVGPLADGVPPEKLREAIRSAGKMPYDLLRTSWEIEDRPTLLTGEGQHGSPVLIRLVDALIKAGAPGVVAPACPNCQRVILLTHTHEGLRICKPCYRKVRATATCADCGVRCMPSGRTDDGAPLCGNCWNKQPENHITCIRCGEDRHIGQRTPDGPLCKNCYRMPLATCMLCGQVRHCAGVATGMPRCPSCSHVKRLCVRCHKTLQPAVRLPEGHLCHTCWSKEPDSFKPCTRCGTVEHLYHHGLCAACACGQHVTGLLAGPDGEIRPGLEPVHQALTDNDDPRRVMHWLVRDNPATELLQRLGDIETPLDHNTLDALPPSKSIEHLRAVLVNAEILAPRDERLRNLETWIAAKLDEVADPDARTLLRAFATWNQIGRLRQRLKGSMTSVNQTTAIRATIRMAIALLNWLHDHDIDLKECTQHHLDIWLDEGAQTRLHARAFVKWAVTNGHAPRGLEVPPPSREHPTPPMDDEARWATARRLLNDDQIRLSDRVAGLLILLYAQPLSVVARIRAEQVIHDDDQVSILLGDVPLRLPEPMGSLVAELVTSRRSHAVIGRTNDSIWLFPGKHADRHTSERHLGGRLRRFGIYTNPTRHAALRDLSAQLPAAVVARMLGLSTKAATRWQEENNQAWATYAAEVSRRR